MKTPMKTQPPTLTERLAKLLTKGKTITGASAFRDLGTLSIRNRVYDLEEIGWEIKHTPIIKNGKRFMSYKLISAP